VFAYVGSIQNLKDLKDDWKGEVFAYVGSIQNLKDLKDLLDPRDLLLHSDRTQGFAADPVYMKGEVFAYVGRNQNLKDLVISLYGRKLSLSHSGHFAKVAEPPTIPSTRAIALESFSAVLST
jgi:hypothetical protein